MRWLRTCALPIWLCFAGTTCDPVIAAAPTTGRASACITIARPDAALEAIITEIFRNTPKSLLGTGIISTEFFEVTQRARFEICDDRVLDVVALPRDPPVILFDSFFMSFLGHQAQALVLGQHIGNDHEGVGTLDLHKALVKQVVAQNLDTTIPSMTLEELISEATGRNANVRKYLGNDVVRRQTESLILTTFYFVIFHEFCHVTARHLERKKEILEMPDAGEASRKTRDSQLVELEKEADACAIDIMNRDEAQYSSSPISFFGAFMVASTQSILERVLPRRGSPAMYPSPLERLRSAYEINLEYIEKVPNSARYKATLDAVYQHFARLVSE